MTRIKSFITPIKGCSFSLAIDHDEIHWFICHGVVVRCRCINILIEAYRTSNNQRSPEYISCVEKSIPLRMTTKYDIHIKNDCIQIGCQIFSPFDIDFIQNEINKFDYTWWQKLFL